MLNGRAGNDRQWRRPSLRAATSAPGTGAQYGARVAEFDPLAAIYSVMQQVGWRGNGDRLLNRSIDLPSKLVGPCVPIGLLVLLSVAFAVWLC